MDAKGIVWKHGITKWIYGVITKDEFRRKFWGSINFVHLKFKNVESKCSALVKWSLRSYSGV